MGSGIAQWLQRQTGDREVPGSSLRRSGGRIFFSILTFCADSYFGICSISVLPQSHVKDPGHSAKSASGSLPLSKHTPYVCDFAWSDIVHGCMVYTERAETAAVSCGTSHSSAVSTPLMWIFKNALCKATHSQCRVTFEHSESARERRTALYKSDQQQQQHGGFSTEIRVSTES